MTLTPPVFRKLSGLPDVTRLEKKKTALVLIEFQTEHFTGNLPIQDAHTILPQTVKIMDWADKHKIKTFHVQHLAKSPASPIFASGSQGFEFYPPTAPRKKHEVQIKYASSAFVGSQLHTVLQSANIDTLILTGMSTPTSIAVTAHDARLLGYKSLVVADLTASRDVLSWDKTQVISATKMQETALANIADKFAQVVSSADVMALPLV